MEKFVIGTHERRNKTEGRHIVMPSFCEMNLHYALDTGLVCSQFAFCRLSYVRESLLLFGRNFGLGYLAVFTLGDNFQIIMSFVNGTEFALSRTLQIH